MRRLLLAGLVLLPGPGIAAAAFHNPEDIRATAARHALGIGQSQTPSHARIRADASRLDPRLQLVACSVPLEAFSPPGQRPSGRLSVGVRCPSAAWSLYVPVRLEVLTDVVVLTAPATRGQPLNSQQLSLETRDVAIQHGGYLSTLEAAVGMVPRRALAAGSILSPGAIELPKLVRRGQRVRLVSHAASFAVEAEGEALGDAASGERVRVRNLRSGQIVEGVVDDEGLVRMGSDPTRRVAG